MKPYWVEVKRAAKDRRRVIGYTVFKADDGNRYGKVIKNWPITKTRSAEVALFLANGLRDDLNAGID